MVNSAAEAYKKQQVMTATPEALTLMLYVLAEPVVTFIYNAPAAKDATQAIAVAICFLGMHQITTAILQGLKKPKIPVLRLWPPARYR